MYKVVILVKRSFPLNVVTLLVLMKRSKPGLVEAMSSVGTKAPKKHKGRRGRNVKSIAKEANQAHTQMCNKAMRTEFGGKFAVAAGRVPLAAA